MILISLLFDMDICSGTKLVINIAYCNPYTHCTWTDFEDVNWYYCNMGIPWMTPNFSLIVSNDEFWKFWGRPYCKQTTTISQHAGTQHIMFHQCYGQEWITDLFLFNVTTFSLLLVFLPPFKIYVVKPVYVTWAVPTFWQWELFIFE